MLKFVMESSVLGRSGESDGELGILPVSVPFAALIESSLFPPLSPLSLRRERTREGEERADFLRYYHTTAQRRIEERGKGRGGGGKKSGTLVFNVKKVVWDRCFLLPVMRSD